VVGSKQHFKNKEIKTMAKLTDNIFTQGISGTIAKKMTMRQVRGDTIIGRKSRGTKARPTEKQLDVRYKFKNASYYVASVMEDPDTKAAYAAAAAKVGISVFNLVQRDAFQSPVITRIFTGKYKGQPGDIITIKTSAPFKVASVKVVLLFADGSLLEEGEAAQGEHRNWYYTVTGGHPTPVGNRIIVTARNLPGNETVKEAMLMQ
jgi:hypothetical protein